MPPENKKEAQKQKIMLGATALIVIFVAWQGYKLLAGGDDTPAATTTAATAAKSGAPAAQQGTNTLAATNAASGQSSAPQEPAQPKQVPVPANAELVKLQQDTQVKYITALNELQMLKVQKEIAETKQAITSSTLANATAEKSITDLLTVQQMPAQNAYIPPPQPAATPAADTSKPMPVQMSFVELPYVVISLTYKANKWNAVLTYQDKFFSVGVGDTLPPDSSVVTAIDKNGVTLQGKDKNTRKVLIAPTL